MLQWFMKSLSLNLTVDQVKALVQLSQNQIFRLKFIDPKMPGFKAHPGELEAAQAAVEVLSAALKEDQLKTPSSWEMPSRYGKAPAK